MVVKQAAKLKREVKVKRTRRTVKVVETRQCKPLPGPLLNHVKKTQGSNDIKLSWTVSENFITIYKYSFCSRCNGTGNAHLSDRSTTKV